MSLVKSQIKIVCADCRQPLIKNQDCFTMGDVEDGIVSLENYKLRKSQRKSGYRKIINAKCSVSICIGCDAKAFRKWGRLPDDVQRYIADFIPQAFTLARLYPRILRLSGKLATGRFFEGFTRQQLSNPTRGENKLRKFYTTKGASKEYMIRNLIREMNTVIDNYSRYDTVAVLGSWTKWDTFQGRMPYYDMMRLSDTKKILDTLRFYAKL